jgi:hypothetical protein
MTQQASPKDNKLFIPFLVAMGVILLLLLWLIFKKHEPEPVSNNSKAARDSVIMLTGQIEEQKNITDHYLHQVDSLKSLPPIITIIYREQRKFTSTATINQLDSIIRSNSGLQPRTKRYR